MDSPKTNRQMSVVSTLTILWSIIAGISAFAPGKPILLFPIAFLLLIAGVGLKITQNKIFGAMTIVTWGLLIVFLLLEGKNSISYLGLGVGGVIIFLTLINWKSLK
jgi:hypothetical protein